MPVCSVAGCKSRYYIGPDETQKVGFHRFPDRARSPNRFRKWVNYCRRKEFHPTKDARICSVHFRSLDYNRTAMLKTTQPGERFKGYFLNPGSVPSVPFVEWGADPSKFRKGPKRRVVETLPKVVQCENNAVPPDKPANSLLDEDECMIDDQAVECELGGGNADGSETDSLHSKDSKSPNEKADSSETDSLDSEDFKSFEHASEFEYYLVSWSSLSQFFERCSVCRQKVTDISKNINGTALTVHSHCLNCGTQVSWDSQPKIAKRPEGNILLATALILSGIIFSSFQCFFKLLKTPPLSREAFDYIVYNFTAPGIKKIWAIKKMENLTRLRTGGKPAWIAGDGQYDTPGLSPKHLTYSLMDLQSSKILDFALAKKGRAYNELEKSACEEGLKKLIEDGCNVQQFFSDGHSGVRCALEQFPHVKHELDVWHLSESLMQRFEPLERKFPIIQAWKKSISIHLRCCALTCEGNSAALIETFTSVLHHVINEHKWTEDGKEKSCAHIPLTEEEMQKRCWIKADSEEYDALKKIITDKSFLEDLEQVKHYVHTGSFEPYRDVRLKYAPMHVNFTYDELFLRNIIAILDYNENLHKDKLQFLIQKQATSSTSSENEWKRTATSNILKIGGRPEVLPLRLVLAK